ncbi:MAG: VCBS repeat-containing protein [Elusimicrobia bacterium]|nr:VCBS repeat-containing protein [Elusimicrobiota bacterium]
MGSWTRLGLVVLLLSAACGCGGLQETVSVAKKVPVLRSVRWSKPEYAAAMKQRGRFAPHVEFFRSDEGVWGADKRLGAMWAYDPPDGVELDGLAVAPGTGLVVLESPQEGGQSLVLIDSAGRPISRSPVTGPFTALQAGELGGRKVLLAWGQDGLQVLDLSGLPVWKESLQAERAALADIGGDGGGELVAGTGGPGALAAFAADRRKLWSRGDLPQVLGLAASRGFVAVFASSAGVSSSLILDGQGRTVARFSDETAPERGVFLSPEGPAVFLAHVGSSFQSGRDRLRVSRLVGGARTVAAEADIGPTHVVDMIAADFNGDGRKEIALATENGWVFVYDEHARLLGERHHSGEVPHLAAGDINGDGRDELLVGAAGANSRVFAYGVITNPEAKTLRIPQSSGKP